MLVSISYTLRRLRYRRNSCIRNVSWSPGPTVCKKMDSSRQRSLSEHAPTYAQQQCLASLRHKAFVKMPQSGKLNSTARVSDHWAYGPFRAGQCASPPRPFGDKEHLVGLHGFFKREHPAYLCDVLVCDGPIVQSFQVEVLDVHVFSFVNAFNVIGERLQRWFKRKAVCRSLRLGYVLVQAVEYQSVGPYVTAACR